MRLAGQVALVTGAQQGIGRAIAVALAQDGADVAVNYLDDRTAADEVVAQVRGAGRRACLAQGDVSRARDADAIVARVASELGAPTILVNNAGVFPRVEFLARNHLVHQTDLQGPLRIDDLGEVIGRAAPVHEDPRFDRALTRGHAEPLQGRIGEIRILGRDDDVGSQPVMGTTADAITVNRSDRRLGETPTSSISA